MSRPQPPAHAKLVASLILRERDLLPQLAAELEGLRAAGDRQPLACL